jgi:electron transfer flavoprotein beta subunit
MLEIVVCVKVVSDPEAPASTFKIDAEKRRVLPGAGVPPVLNPYDENSLEAALKIKEKQPTRITVISAGKNIPKAVIRKSLAVGADDLVALEDDLFEEIDGYTTAVILAAAVKKLPAFDLILAGRMASDTNAGQVGPGIAELLGIPGISVAQKLDVADGRVRVERALADGHETVEVPLPCLVTVSHEIGELRQASVKGLMAAQKQTFTTWKAADLGITGTSVRQQKPLKLYIPARGVSGEIVTGETPEETGANLAQRLREINII